MPDKPCTCADILTRIATLEAEIEAFEKLMLERDARYQLRADAQDQAVKVAILNSEKAVGKAEASTEKRFESVNEFRSQLADQASRLMPRSEYDVQHRALEDRVTAIETSLEEKITSNETRINLLQQNITSILARGGGLKDAWGYLVAIAGIAIAIIAVWFRRE